MKVKFTKMQGIGNDYVYIDCTDFTLPDETAAAIKLSDRHFGIGGDGLILIKRGKSADFEMVMYNVDGSRAEMCGNGMRCVAKFVYDKKLTDKTHFTVESMGKIKDIALSISGGKVDQVRVGMGEPEFLPTKIPVIAEGSTAFNVPVETAQGRFLMNCVSMGNPHAVIFVDEITDSLVLKTGKELEKNPIFPQRANIEFAHINDAKNITMRVWERGTGETLACGTGACATAVAAMVNGLVGDTVTLHLSGGDLKIHWKSGEQVIMTGPAQTVFEGETEL